MSAKNLLLGLIVGAAAGAVVGILYAPDKGEKTRNKLKKQTDKLSAEIKEGVDEILDSIKEQVDRTKGMVSDAEKAGKDVKDKVSSATS